MYASQQLKGLYLLRRENNTYIGKVFHNQLILSCDNIKSAFSDTVLYSLSIIPFCVSSGALVDANLFNICRFLFLPAGRFT